MGCSVSGDTLQYRLEEGISHRHTRQVTQLFTYLLMNVAQLPRPHWFVFFCVMTHQNAHDDCQHLPKIWVGTFLVCNVHLTGKTELILMVKTETKHPAGEPFGREFLAFVSNKEL